MTQVFVPFHHHHHVPLDREEWQGVKIFFMTVLFLTFVLLTVLAALGRLDWVHV